MDEEVPEKRQESRIASKVRAWVTGRMEVHLMKIKYCRRRGGAVGGRKKGKIPRIWFGTC